MWNSEKGKCVCLTVQPVYKFVFAVINELSKCSQLMNMGSCPPLLHGLCSSPTISCRFVWQLEAQVEPQLPVNICENLKKCLLCSKQVFVLLYTILISSECKPWIFRHCPATWVVFSAQNLFRLAWLLILSQNWAMDFSTYFSTNRKA